MKAWSELSPRERDALVAEKVMGEKLPSYKVDYERLFSAGAITCTYEEFLDLQQDIWSPSTSIAAAWDVVAKLRGRDSLFQLHEQQYPAKNGPELVWEVGFFDFGDDPRVLGEATSSISAAEAICLAALRSLGIPV